MKIEREMTRETQRERKYKDRRNERGKKGEIDTQRQKERKSEKRELGQIYIKEGLKQQDKQTKRASGKGKEMKRDK